MSLGINISKSPIPVVPAAHYMCGGVVVDENGCSSIENLMVLGESSNTGLHGGNRLASNSLLEAVVFSDRAYKYIRDNIEKLKKINFHVEKKEAKTSIKKPIEEEILINHNWESIRRTMWNYVGIVRNQNRLELAKNRLKNVIVEIDDHYNKYALTENMVELRNISQIALLIVEAAIARKNSRGLHHVSDSLSKNQENWWNVFRLNTDGDRGNAVSLVRKKDIK